MTPVPGKEYEYKAREAFPLDMEASIVAPAYSDGTGNPYLQGNELKFGMDNGKIVLNATKNIGFENTGYGEDGKYEITFNTLTFEGSPFPKFGVRFDTQNKFLESMGRAMFSTSKPNLRRMISSKSAVLKKNMLIIGRTPLGLTS